MEPNAPQPPERQQTKPLSVVSAILGECLCVPFPLHDRGGLSANSQFIELHGIEFIGLGAVIDELSAKQRIRETVAQLLKRQTNRLISIGYLMDDETNKSVKITQTIPLDLWSKTYPNDNKMNAPLQRVIDSIQSKDFESALKDLIKTYDQLKAHPTRGINKYLLGITAHNIAVVHVILNREEQALSMFQQAVTAKRLSFGQGHLEVALSLDELGIQFFAQEKFHEAMHIFSESKKIRLLELGGAHPKVAMVLNNVACCHFQLGNHLSALVTLKEARGIQKNAVGPSARGDLDLLHVAITLCNIGYMQIRLKHYEHARSSFDEALMIQQSVYGDDNNKAIRDTLSNMEFTNAFHSLS